MATTSLPATFDTAPLELASLGRSAGIGEKGCEGIRDAMDILALWRDCLGAEHGPMSGLLHRGHPHELPEIDVLFEQRSVGLERALLHTHPTRVAPASGAEAGADSEELMASFSRGWERTGTKKPSPPRTWSDMAAEHKAEKRAAIEILQRKPKAPRAEIICLIDHITLGGTDAEWLASAIWTALNVNELAEIGDRWLIFHHRNSPEQYFSAAIRRGHFLQAQRNGKLVECCLPMVFPEWPSGLSLPCETT